VDASGGRGTIVALPGTTIKGNAIEVPHNAATVQQSRSSNPHTLENTGSTQFPANPKDNDQKRKSRCGSNVVFRFTSSGQQDSKTRRVTGQEFVRGFLQHSLPSGFHRIRYYGFLNSHSSLSIDYVRMLVWFYLGWNYVLAKRVVPEVRPKRSLLCDECGGQLRLVEITDHLRRVVYRVPFLDSS